MIDEELQNKTTGRNIRNALGLITEEEMAAALRLNSVSTLATWRSQGRGPANVKIGKRIFYTLNDLRDWVVGEARKQHANDNQPAKAAA